MTLALIAGLGASAQTNSSSTAKKSSTGGGDLYEINLFGGGNFVNRQNSAPHQDNTNGGVGTKIADANCIRYFCKESAYLS